MRARSNPENRKAVAPTAAHRREYERRVNRVIDYIQAHLAEELTLEKLASVAAFSPFHFHRVFAAMTGETLSDFIRRIRLERAATMLAMLRDTSIIEIALRYGFSSAATFARAFRNHFGMSATQWRDDGAGSWNERRRREDQRKPDSNLRQHNRNPGKASRRQSRHGRATRETMSAMRVEITDIPAYRVAYMRHVGPYVGGDIGGLWADFERWLRVRDLRRPGTLTIGIGHDAPRIAPPDKLRYDACVVVDNAFTADRFVNVIDLPGGRYATAEFDGPTAAISGAWDRLFTTWLPGSGYQPEDRPCLELYEDHDVQRAPDRVCCRLCIPVRPL